MRGRETASGRMEKSAVLAPVPKQKVSIVEREGPGWTVWLDSQGDGDCPICGTGPNSRHGSYVRPLRDLPAQGTSVLIQATRRVAGSPRAPRFTCHKMGCGAIGMPRRASARAPHRVKQSPITVSATTMRRTSHNGHRSLFVLVRAVPCAVVVARAASGVHFAWLDGPACGSMTAEPAAPPPGAPGVRLGCGNQDGAVRLPLGREPRRRLGGLYPVGQRRRRHAC
jgi:hypothetical protein